MQSSPPQALYCLTTNLTTQVCGNDNEAKIGYLMLANSLLCWFVKCMEAQLCRDKNVKSYTFYVFAL